MTHVAVVGAGVVGAAIALALADRGARVTLVDAGGPRASDASFGWINAAPGNSGAYLALRVAAMAEWRRWDGCSPTGARWTGALTWEEPEETLAAHADALAAHGIPARLVGAAEIATLAPALTAPPAAALWCPGDGVADAGAVAAQWRAAALAAGAAWHPGSVRRVAPGTLHLTTGVVEADRIILACGTGTAALGGVAVTASPGLIAHTAPLPPLLAPLLAAPDLTCAQGPDGRLRAATTRAGSDPGADPARTAARAIADLAALLGRPLTLAQWTVGHRPMPGDGLPLIGPLGPAYVAAMHSGVTLAPLVARLVADEVLDATPRPLLAAFRPDRAVDRAP